MRQSKGEIAFRAKYPNGRIHDSKAAWKRRYSVFAGDYLCAEGPTVALTYREAVRQERLGNISPDPNEVAHTAIGVGFCKVCQHYGMECTGIPAAEKGTR
jgi:hypothetical protein